MRPFLLLAVLTCSGCVCLDPTHKNLPPTIPPAVTTDGVKGRISETKSEITKAGEASQGINRSANKAQSLAERVDKILEELDKQNQ
jgi:hypothetical protein